MNLGDGSETRILDISTLLIKYLDAYGDELQGCFNVGSYDNEVCFSFIRV